MPASVKENELPKTSAPVHKKLKTEKSTDKSKDPDPAKRSKSAKTKAKLSLLPSLPLDVLFEIFGHLAPLDVLNMARATKDLRRVLMHRSAISIWKTSLRQVSGLPECPQEMSEPAWVNLVFSAHCHNCFAHRVQKVDWILRIRLCKQCIKSSNILKSDKHLDMANKLDKIVSQCVPFSSTSHIRGHKGKCCLAKEEREFRKDLQAAERDKSEFVKDRKKAMEVRAEHAAECRAWMTSQNQDRWDELEEIRDKRRSDIADKLEDLGFLEELDYLEDLAQSFGRVTPALLLFDDHPDVKVSKPLTERSWKNMERRLVEYMHMVEAHRLAADRLRIVRQREQMAVSSWVQFRLGYSAERLLPSGTDILSWDKVKAIIELPSSVPVKLRDPEAVETKVMGPADEAADDERHETPQTSLNPTIISPASFTRVFSSMSGFISQWEAKKIRELCRRNLVGAEIPFSFSPTARDLIALRLAACVFTCEDECLIHSRIEHYQNNFYPAMFYPEFLHHPCTTIARREGDDEKNAPFNPLFKASKDFGWHRRKEWSTDSMFFDEKASRAVKRLLEACGLDYTVVTTEEMDSLDPRFICLKCSYGAKCDGQRPRKVMPWRNAVQHCMLVHWGDASVTWEKISEESAQEARMLSAARSSIGSNIWRCAHCRDSSADRDGKNTEELIQDHLDARHGILDPVKDRDYYRAVDRPPPAIATVQMTPKVVEIDS
ncbi:hypothetical protein FB451DRAFT_1078197 [Mycena latifolia]|nr:hypothetical protein FB451DRAFT_1078197 [Mycena latifolia]